MKEEQKYIYYAAGETTERIEALPQTEMISDKGYEILYFTDDIDEFAIRMMRDFDGKEYKSVSGSDLGFEPEDKSEEQASGSEALFNKMKAILGERVTKVRASKRLKSHAVCLASDGELSIEMEKVLAAMPDNQGLKADKVFEINTAHEIFGVLKEAAENDSDKLNLYTELLYNQALLTEGLSIEDPAAFASDILKLMK
jgi:molecular chaperone HtpG